jgi:hypothetical protein
MNAATRRSLPLIALLVAILALPGSASAGGQGFNPATRKLEAAFTIVLRDRVSSNTACYKSPAAMAKLIGKEKGLKTGVAAKGAPRSGIVYVLKRGTTCNVVRMAFRQGNDLYILDSGVGEIRLVGKNRGENTAKLNRGPLRALTMATKSFQVNSENKRLRFETICPGRTYPLGGGIVTNPGLGPDGEGIYPHSYERLGAQRGWHITAWLFDPTHNGASRNLTVQAVCGKGLVPMSSPHKTTFIRPGETKSVTSRCPGGQVLMSGGYQRTDFLDDGGNYVTESRAVGTNAWTVTGTAYGRYGGELTSLGYCVRSKGPLLTEVASPSTPVPFGMPATATTPPCPGGGRLTAGGFSAGGATQTFFAGGGINQDNTWTARSFGFFGPSPGLTAYGYCLQPGV